MKAFLKFWNKFGMFALLLLLVAFFGITKGETFLTEATFLNILRQCSIIGTMSCGIMMIIITGATDISVGGRAAFITCAIAYMSVAGLPAWGVVIAAIILGVITGALNAILAETLHTGVFVVSIATNNIWYGLTYIMTKGVMINGFGDDIKAIAQTKVIGNIPSIAFIWVGCALVASFILGRTRFGRHVYALGGNRNAAFLAGIDVVKTNIAVHALAGVFLGLGSAVYLSRSMYAAAGMGTTYSFDCITACVLGGVTLGGGRGKVYQCVMGVLVIYVLFNGLTMFGISDFVRQVVTGIILLLAIVMEVLQRNAKVDLSDDTAGGNDAKTEKAVKAAE